MQDLFFTFIIYIIIFEVLHNIRDKPCCGRARFWFSGFYNGISSIRLLLKNFVKRFVPIGVCHHHRVILAIGKHVGAAEAAVCGYIPIRIDKAPDLGVVVTGVQVVEAGFLVKVVAAVAQGVDVGNVAGVPRDVVALPVGDGENIAPGVVGIFCRQVAVFVRQPDDVPLQVLDQRIPYVLVIQRADGICLCCVLELKI